MYAAIRPELKIILTKFTAAEADAGIRSINVEQKCSHRDHRADQNVAGEEKYHLKEKRSISRIS
jgi:hypothetical protein